VARNPKAGTRFIGCWAKHRTTRSCQVRDRHYESPAVYAWARRAVMPTSRRLRASRASTARRRYRPTHVDVTEDGKKLCRGPRLWTIAVATFKSETYRHLRLMAPSELHELMTHVTSALTP
jgi:hypothetical protein